MFVTSSSAAQRCSLTGCGQPTVAPERYGPTRLIGLAWRLDPGLTARDFAEAGQRLDQIDDAAFARYGLVPAQVAVIRARFAAWPRVAEAEHDAEPGPDDFEAGR